MKIVSRIAIARSQKDTVFIKRKSCEIEGFAKLESLPSVASDVLETASRKLDRFKPPAGGTPEVFKAAANHRPLSGS
jgi:hypothetical protein